MEGTALRGLIERAGLSGRWPLDEALSAALVRPVLLALIDAHAKTPPLPHRSVAAERVQVSTDGQVLLEPPGGERSSGSAMSPEQAHGRALDERSDVYGAGALLFELACGRPVVESISALALGELLSARAANPQLSDAFAAVLEHALDPEPLRRFASAQAMLEALDAAVKAADAAALSRWVRELPAAAPRASRPQGLELGPGPTVTPPRKRSVKQWLVPAVGIAVALSGTLVGLQVLEHHQLEKQAEYEASLRRCDVLSQPAGAQILLDGKLYPERTPSVLKLERGREYALELRGPGLGVKLALRDPKKVVVHQVAQRIEPRVETEFWDAAPNPHPAGLDAVPGGGAATGSAREAVSNVAAVAPPTPSRPEVEALHVVLDAESAPVTFKLSRAHEVVVSTATCREVHSHSLVLERQPQAYSVAPTGRPQSTEDFLRTRRLGITSSVPGIRTLPLLYLGGVGTTDLMGVALFPAVLDFKTPHQVCPFVLTDRSLDQLVVEPVFSVGTATEYVKHSLVTVPPEHRFLVRSLPHHKRWSVSASAYHPPYAVMTVHSANGEAVRVLDQRHTLPVGAESVWFTVPVLEESDVDYTVSVTEASNR